MVRTPLPLWDAFGLFLWIFLWIFLFGGFCEEGISNKKKKKKTNQWSFHSFLHLTFVRGGSWQQWTLIMDLVQVGDWITSEFPLFWLQTGFEERKGLATVPNWFFYLLSPPML